ncbi:MAG: PQQ-dependent sugar dehydrogenase [Cyclobacteriaceae bacterium]|nr:PQQ-dependent sugar dehydrogenase [Cyclobacteriaceae bacterium]
MAKFLTRQIVHCLFIGVVLLLVSCSKSDKKILVFGYDESHDITNELALLQNRLQQEGWLADTTTNPDNILEDSLRHYALILFVHEAANTLNHYQQTDVERFVEAGGKIAGINAAGTLQYGWGWYNELIGALQTKPSIQTSSELAIHSPDHPASQGLLAVNYPFTVHESKLLSPDLQVLSSYYQNDQIFPVSWIHEFKDQQVFYTGIELEAGWIQEPTASSILISGLQWLFKKARTPDYHKAISPRVPAEDRFVKTVLAVGEFFEPTELAVLPNLDVLIVQRRGEVLRYSNNGGDVKQVGFLDVYHKATVPGVNAEEGLLGIAADPDFAKNRFVYMFYSPIDTSVNRLSRFVFRNDTILPSSETKILEFYSQRNICCHTGGSLAFGPDGLLYISTGDNSNPFNIRSQPFINSGFAPLDDRSGKEQSDARRSSGNTNDLRGKILRIKVHSDGSYSIPEGNLFSQGEPGTRPEIYVMGNRNPYRISVDQKNSYLYWGEVGPDAGNDSLNTRGPRGYDEFNQARSAGFFGWPLFIGDNYAYRDYDYSTGKSGSTFDPERPLNLSGNNTGKKELPSAQPAFIWYPYAVSDVFPSLGTGSRTAMAGPVYYADLYDSQHKYPDYYSGKLFIYEWMRNWIKVVSMNKKGDFMRMEPFIPHAIFNAPIDMEVGPDGRFYIVEYGKGWFSKNDDAALVRIDYIAGNRPPKVGALVVEKSSGLLPFHIRARVEATDPENDKLQYIWHIGDQKHVTRKGSLDFPVARYGDYSVSVEVVDEKGASAFSNTVYVYAGNEQPVVDILVEGNTSFYFPGRALAYSVSVKDPGDMVDYENLYVSADYIEGTDLSSTALGHQEASMAMTGKSLSTTLNCMSCHKVDGPSVGPSYQDVAKKYHQDQNGLNYLTGKVRKGGAGVWGSVAMPAHPDAKESELKMIVQWILSLEQSAQLTPTLPASGIITADKDARENMLLAINATYTDQGGKGIKPLSGSGTLKLRNPRVLSDKLEVEKGFRKLKSGGTNVLQIAEGENIFIDRQIDLNDIQSIMLELDGVLSDAVGSIEVRQGRVDGPVLFSAGYSIAANQKSDIKLEASSSVKQGKQDLYFILKSKTEGPMLKALRYVPQ